MKATQKTQYQFISNGMPAASVGQVDFSEGISTLYTVDVEVYYLASLDFTWLGSRGTLTFGTADAPQTVHGVIDAVTVLPPTAEGASGWRLRLVPAVAALRRGRRSRIFQHLTVLQVAEQLIAPLDCGLVAALPDDLQLPKIPYCVQYEESDWDFLARLLAEFGLFYLFEQSGATETLQLHFGLHPTACAKTHVYAGAEVDDARERLQSFRVSRSLRGATAVEVTEYAWHWPQDCSVERYPKTQAASADGNPSEGATTPTSWTKWWPLKSSADCYPRNSIAEGEPIEVAVAPAAGPRSYYANARGEGGYEFTVPEIADRLHSQEELYTAFSVKMSAKLIYWRQARQAWDGTGGQTNLCQVRCGMVLQVTHQNNARFSGEYRVTSVRHRGASAQDAAGAHRQGLTEFACVPVSLPFAPDLPAVPARRPGLQTAVVIGASGQEDVMTDKHGRIKVRFLWEGGDGTSSCNSAWIRVSQAAAANGQGSVLLPAVGSEVIVNFFHDDLSQPVVQGCLYNGQVPTPELLPNMKAKSTFCSRRGGQTLGGGQGLALPPMGPAGTDNSTGGSGPPPTLRSKALAHVAQAKAAIEATMPRSTSDILDLLGVAQPAGAVGLQRSVPERMALQCMKHSAEAAELLSKYDSPAEAYRALKKNAVKKIEKTFKMSPVARFNKSVASIRQLADKVLNHKLKGLVGNALSLDGCATGSSDTHGAQPRAVAATPGILDLSCDQNLDRLTAGHTFRIVKEGLRQHSLQGSTVTHTRDATSLIAGTLYTRRGKSESLLEGTCSRNTSGKAEFRHHRATQVGCMQESRATFYGSVHREHASHMLANIQGDAVLRVCRNTKILHRAKIDVQANDNCVTIRAKDIEIDCGTSGHLMVGGKHQIMLRKGNVHFYATRVDCTSSQKTDLGAGKQLTWVGKEVRVQE